MNKLSDKIKLANGTVKDVYRLCVERSGVQNNFTIDTSTIGNISKIVRLSGTLTQANGLSENAESAVKWLIKFHSNFIIILQFLIYLSL